MDDRGANIDIVFRNGLKDYEVLPPQGIWENILPVVRRKQRPPAVFRAAAMFAVLVSLSALAYWFSKEIPSAPQAPVMALNQETFTPSPGIMSPALPVSDNTDASTVSKGSFVPAEEVVEPVTIANLTPAVQNPDGALHANELAVNSKDNTDYPAPGYIQARYVGLYEENTLAPADNSAGKAPNRWSLTALVSPTYQSHFSTGTNEAVSQVMNTEQTVLSYSGGVALSYKISKRFSVRSGLYYSTTGRELSGVAAYSGFKDHFYTKGSPNFTVLTSSGNIYTSNNDIFLADGLLSDRIQTSYNNNVFDPVKASLTYLDNSIQQNFSYLELPVILKYKIIDRTLDFNLIGGVSSNLLVNNTVFALSDNGKTTVGTTDGMNIITFSSSVGMGMEYNLSDNLSLNLEPTFRYYINPFTDIPGIRIHPYSFGIFSGISYKF